MPTKRRKSPSPAPIKPIYPLLNEPSPPPEVHNYIVDRLFRKGEISLIGGPTYVGKTTLMFQIIRDWMAERPVLGYQSWAAPCCYITTIHTTQHAKDVMSRVGAEVEIVSTVGTGAPRNIEAICNDAVSAVPDVEVIFIDGIHPLCTGNSNDPGVVTMTLAEISRLLNRFNLTLVASGCSSKPKDHYSSTRDRFAGAYSWLQGSSAFVSIDYMAPENPSDARRVITVHSKSGLADRLHYRFSPEGILVPVLNGNSDPLKRFGEFDGVLFANEPGTIMTTQDIVDIGEVLGLSRSTVNRRLIDLMDSGGISKAKWGEYRIERIQ